MKYVHTTGTVQADNPNVTASDKKNIKPIKDCTLVNASNAAAVAARVYAYWEHRDTLSSKIVVTDEQPGDYVSVPTKYNGTITSNIKSMKIKLSSKVAADVEVRARRSLSVYYLWRGRLSGAFGGIMASAKLTNFRLEKLEQKVDEHNNFGKRIPVIEEQIKVMNHRIEDLEHEA